MMVDYMKNSKEIHPGILSKVKPVSDKIWDIELEIPGSKP